MLVSPSITEITFLTKALMYVRLSRVYKHTPLCRSLSGRSISLDTYAFLRKDQNKIFDPKLLAISVLFEERHSLLAFPLRFPLQ